MSRLLSDTMPVMFHDAAAYFSTEEWALLHEWQKELYRNVMKEIHQALISLGPLIATTVYSLKAKGKEDLGPVDGQGSEKWHGVNNSTRISHLNADVCWKKEESDEFLMPCSGGEVQQHCTSPNPAHEVISFLVDEDVERYSVEREAVEKCGGMSRFRGNGIITGPKNKEPADCTVTTMSCNSASEKDRGLVLQNNKGTECGNRQQSERNEHLKGEIATECDVSNPSYSLIQQKSIKKESSDTSNDGESNLDSTTFLIREPNGQQNRSVYLFPAHKQTIFQKADEEKHYRVPTKHRPYQCPVCGQTFIGKGDLNRHQTKHTGEKPFKCDECNKRFTRKGTLIIHQRIHSGERPYHCPECDASFIEQKPLIRHLKVHMK